MELEDVLDAFAMEGDPTKATLERYIRMYPQYAGDLIDLSRELMRPEIVDSGPLSIEDQARIDEAWKTHVAAQPRAVDPFATLTPTRSREVAEELGVPRQVITAFRERRVFPSSVPMPFLHRFAAAMRESANQFLLTLAMPSTKQLARSYKADRKPGNDQKVTFEQVLIEAGVSAEDRARLLTKEE